MQRPVWYVHKGTVAIARRFIEVAKVTLGYEPEPPVCETHNFADRTCQICRDPHYDMLIASSCTQTVITQQVKSGTGKTGELACYVAHKSLRFHEALCLRDHACGSTYFPMHPVILTVWILYVAPETLTQTISTCDIREINNTTPTLSEILNATTGDLAENIIAFLVKTSSSRRLRQRLMYGV